MSISWMVDGTGRFRKRPFFSLEEMDRHCERIVHLYNGRLYGQSFPGLRTDALMRMLNNYSDLHLYADLSKYGAGARPSPVSRLARSRPCVLRGNYSLTGLRIIT